MYRKRLQPALLALALMVTALVTSPGPVAAAPEPRITATASAASVPVGGSFKITGRATRARTGQKVQLQRRAGSRWKTIATQRLPRGGQTRKVSFKTRIDQGGAHQYRLILVAQRGASGAASNTVKVTGVPKISLAATPSNADLATPVTLSGSVAGGLAGQQVTLWRHDSEWQAVDTTALGAGDQRPFSFTQFGPGPGSVSYAVIQQAQRTVPQVISSPVSVTFTEAQLPAGPVEPIVVGNHLVDGRTGQTWVPHGVNWPDLEYSCFQGWKPSTDFHQLAETQAMATWGIDVARLPLNQDCWLGTDGAPTGDWAGAAEYRAAVRQRVDLAHEAGLVVILDLHRTAPAGIRAGDGQRAMADHQSVTFWGQVATAYKDEPAVMFELYNEPYNLESFGAGELDWPCWRDGGCHVDTANEIQAGQGQLDGVTYETAGMAELLAAVRGAGADQPVLLGGLHWANDLSGWLAHKPAGDDQLVAAWHNYAGSPCAQACRNSTIEAVAAQVPVVMTEFGYSFSQPAHLGDAMAWGDQTGVGYLAHAWWNLPSDPDELNKPFALLQPDSYQPRAPAGTTFRSHLLSLP